MDDSDGIKGLIPAAGMGSRLGRLPCSKELLPVRFRNLEAQSGIGMTAIDNAVGTLVANDITCLHVVLRPGKWDIPAYLGDGSRLGAALSYLVVEASPSVPHSLDCAWRFVRSGEVVLVFPDILFSPEHAIGDIVAARRSNGADAMIALVPSTRGDKVDFVSRDASGRVDHIAAKPGGGNPGWTWVAATWSPRFTDFLHGFVRAQERDRSAAGELYVADVMNAAIAEGLVIESCEYPDGEAIDIGTPEDLRRAWRGTTPGD